jgi:hypothetical protein
MNPQDQLALLKNATEIHHRIQATLEDNSRLQYKLASQREVAARLQQLTLAAAGLMGSVDSTVPETEPSSLKTLAKLDQSSAIAPIDEPPATDEGKLLTGKYLNQLLTVLVEFAEQNQEDWNVVSLSQLEQKYKALFAFAESKEIIPASAPDKGWKKKFQVREPFYAKINELLQSEPDSPDDADSTDP